MSNVEKGDCASNYIRQNGQDFRDIILWASSDSKKKVMLNENE